MYEYSRWKNLYFMMLVIITSSLLVFILNYLFHYMKQCGAKPYLGKKGSIETKKLEKTIEKMKTASNLNEQA